MSRVGGAQTLTRAGEVPAAAAAVDAKTLGDGAGAADAKGAASGVWRSVGEIGKAWAQERKAGDRRGVVRERRRKIARQRQRL